MNELIVKENIKVENIIYEIRGKQVMLDSDLAELYQCKNGTKEINQAVNRNIEKFPERFSWILSDEESKQLLVTICDQKNIERRGGKFKNPRVFTEQKEPVKIDYENINAMNVELIEDDLIVVEDNILRHNSLKLSSIIFSYLMRK